ncbi:MAG: flagellar protein FlaG [Alphaproteobacteria bacterium]|nr:flagellar protein FlaG [Alphaproteobacteria bacterium]
MSIERLGSVGAQVVNSTSKRPVSEPEADPGRARAPKSGDSSSFAATVAETEAAPKTETVQAVQKPQATVMTRLRIEFNEDAARFVYQSVEPTTGRVVQQFPNEDMIRRVAFLREQLAGKVDKSV